MLPNKTLKTCLYHIFLSKTLCLKAKDVKPSHNIIKESLALKIIEK